MIKTFLGLILIFSISNANFVNKGAEAYGKGNKKEAAKLFKKACDLGDGKGCSDLGWMYYSGEGVRQNYQKAVKLLQKACNLGDNFGCGRLGFMYDKGKGVRQNKSTAKEFYGQACDKGINLGCKEYKRLNEAGY